MIDSEFIKFSQLDALNVSRETFKELEEYGSSIIKRNKKINLISSNTEKSINTRHILDCAQTIDLIEENNINVCTDIGSGAGLPGIVLAILMKHKKPLFKVVFYEKSFHKSNFLKEMTKKFRLNTEVHKKNIFEEKNLSTDIIISRAFKPLPIILDLAKENFNKFESIIIFLGKTGKETLSEALTKWQFEYKEKKSITNESSFLIKITNLKKING